MPRKFHNKAALGLLLGLGATMSAPQATAKDTCFFQPNAPGCRDITSKPPHKNSSVPYAARESSKEICLGGARCTYADLESAIKAARSDWLKSKRAPIIDIYPRPNKGVIPVGDARIDFPVTLRYPGQHAEDGYAPVVGGACIDVVGEGDNYPLITLENLQLKSCIRVEYAHVVIKNTWLEAPMGVDAITVTAGRLEAANLSLLGDGGVGVVLATGAWAQFTGLSASGFETGIRSDRVSFSFCGRRASNRIWNVKNGLEVSSQPNRHQLPQHGDAPIGCAGREGTLGAFEITGRGAAASGRGLVIGDGVVVDRLTLIDAEIAGFTRGIDVAIPFARIQGTTLRSNTTAVRFGFEARSQTPTIESVVFAGNQIDLEVASPVVVSGPPIPRCAVVAPNHAQQRELEKEMAKSCAKVGRSVMTGAAS